MFIFSHKHANKITVCIIQKIRWKNASTDAVTESSSFKIAVPEFWKYKNKEPYIKGCSLLIKLQAVGLQLY